MSSQQTSSAQMSSAETSGVQTSRLRCEGLSVGYDNRTVITDLDFVVPDEQITTLIGPNGCGKSTLLGALARLLPTRAGTVFLDGKDVRSMRPKSVARTLGLLPQSPTAPDGLTVADLISRGRHPHQSWLRQASPADQAAVTRALELTNTAELADRPLDALSGGQRQRVWIALALAQETDILLLDEPTTYLDLAHSIEILDLVRELKHVHHKTIVMVLHDLNLAVRYSDHLFVMRDGAIVAQGTPGDVISADLLESAFGLRAKIIPDPVTAGPLIVPVGRRVEN